MFQKTWMRMAGVVVLAVVLVALLAIPLVQLHQAEAAPGAQNIPCYREQGGSKVVAGSGCEYEFQSGSTLDLQSGMTFGAGGGLDLNGSILTYDADADTTAVASTDDVVTITIGTATGLYNVITGNLKIGNGTPTVAQDGEDAYIEGQLEVDGEAQFDGAVDANGTMDVAGAADFASTVQIGADNLYALGYAGSALEFVCGSQVITGENQTITVSALTTVTFAIAALGSDPGAGAGAPYLVTVDAPNGTSSDFVANVWQDDANAATAGATVQWCALGNP